MRVRQNIIVFDRSREQHHYIAKAERLCELVSERLQRPGRCADREPAPCLFPLHSETLLTEQRCKGSSGKEIKMIGYHGPPFFPEKPGLKSVRVRRRHEKTSARSEYPSDFADEAAWIVEMLDQV